MTDLAATARLRDVLASASLVAATGGLFLGRLMIYPVTTVPGSFLERLAAKSTAWDMGHRVMLVGMLAMIPAALVLRRALLARSPRLAEAGAALTILGAALGVGQYAVDFAMLAAARIEVPQGGSQFLAAWQADPFAQLVFYKLPDLAQAGLLLFTVALWRQGPAWRVPAALVTVAAIGSLLAPQLIGNAGVRVALGLWFVGFSAVAWKILHTAQESAATSA